MRRDLLGAGRRAWRPASSIAALAFVAFLATAFWAGVLWIAQLFLRVSAGGFHLEP